MVGEKWSLNDSFVVAIHLRFFIGLYDRNRSTDTHSRPDKKADPCHLNGVTPSNTRLLSHYPYFDVMHLPIIVQVNPLRRLCHAVDDQCRQLRHR
jgi:hypothetical protein